MPTEALMVQKRSRNVTLGTVPKWRQETFRGLGKKKLHVK